MKHAFLFLLLCCLPASGICQKPTPAQRTLPLPRFKAIRASQMIDVKVVDRTPSDQQIRIEAAPNVIDLIKVEVIDNCLHIGLESNLHKRVDQNISNMVVTVPSDGKIERLQASSMSSIRCLRPLIAPSVTLLSTSSSLIEAAVKSEHCTINAASMGAINAAVEASKTDIDNASSARIKARIKGRECEIESSSMSHTSCEVDLSESCDVTVKSMSTVKISGTTPVFEGQASSQGSILGANLDTIDAEAEAKSMGRIEISATRSLKAKAESMSSIRYRGDCTNVDISTSSQGSVKKM